MHRAYYVVDFDYSIRKMLDPMDKRIALYLISSIVDTFSGNNITEKNSSNIVLYIKLLEGFTTILPAAEASLGGLPSHNCSCLSNAHQRASKSMIQQCLVSLHPSN
jgi:hypothetical protein